ncbi:hypothetical protein [Chitinophaga nivalis]|uniref:Uncharacterized protein n=1 Tax=Chitinophaga nivalis TaxID=2991709 RepID=A0ABT3ILR6_9BACT|nr:hypothetical protein [Chitinophaga nivalis]MCW3465635.1 hypothetical protein [Chitinophaga nivalis]MCW3484674.1 hypothetical protein [Chitinophaga nivalis]
MRYLKWQVLSGILLWAATAWGQVPVATLGPAFAEPGDGWDKLLQLKNGNTIYLHFARKEGLTVNVYNPKRELAATDTVRSQLWNAADLESTEIDGIFEIKGQPVVFLQQIVKDSPVLYRLILDGETGKLRQEDKLGALPSIRHRSVYTQDNLASHDCYVEKDRHSDHYAVAFFSGAAIQRTDSIRERIQVLHFSPEHTLINKGWLYLQDTAYNYFSYISMAVQGREKVYLATAGFNTKRKGSEPWSSVVFSMLSPDSSSFESNVLAYTANYGDVTGELFPLPRLQQVRLLLQVPSQQSDGGSGTFLNILSPFTGKLRKHTMLSFPELSRNVRMNLGYKDGYKGVPQRLLQRDDGSSTLLLENIYSFKQGNAQINKLHTNMGDAGIAELDNDGREITTMAVSKSQVIMGICEPFLQHRRNKSEWVFRNKIAALNTNTYLSYDYISIPDASFVLFNDYLQYLDSGGQEKTRKPLKYAADANFVCYRFYAGKMERLFLFGAPEVTKGYAGMMGAADYNADNRVYATVIISRQGSEKKANIAWIQF